MTKTPKTLKSSRLASQRTDTTMFSFRNRILPRYSFAALTVAASCGFLVYLVYYHKAEMETILEERGQATATLIFNRPGLITDCITGKLLGKVPNSLQSVPLKVPEGKSLETDESRQQSFIEVFKTKVWSGKDAFNKDLYGSGSGSTLLYAQEVMGGLHVIITKLKERFGLSRIRLLDLPCGDMGWMNRFLDTRDDVDYTGMDIVPQLITNHSSKYKDRLNWKFRLHDIAKNPLDESYDIILNRQMLQHLFIHDVFKTLKHFSDSGSRFLLTTNFLKHPANGELPSQKYGRFRLLNLEIPPFSFVPPVCLFRDGQLQDSGGKNHFLGLWNLPLETISHCNVTYSFKLPGRTEDFHSCTNWGLN